MIYIDQCLRKIKYSGKLRKVSVALMFKTMNKRIWINSCFTTIKINNKLYL